MIGDVYEIHGLEKGWDSLQGMKCILTRVMGYEPRNRPPDGWCEIEVPGYSRPFPWYIHCSNLRHVEDEREWVNSVW